MALDSFKSMVEKSIRDQIQLGKLFTEPKSQRCSICGLIEKSLPATCWGKAVPGYLMLPDHVCPQDKKPEEYLVSTDVRKACDFVVFSNGIPCFITADERIFYLEQCSKNVPLTVIRDYAFPRGCAVIPFESYQDEQERKNRRVDMQVID